MDEGRAVRIAAVADLHFGDADRGTLKDVFQGLRREADFLLLCGDMTANGRPDEMGELLEELAGVEIPTLAVMGNHDHEGGAVPELRDLLDGAGVHVLDGDHVTIQGIGFVGAKGFAGGFGRASLAPFGEKLIKEFVQAAVDESLKLENGLRNLSTDINIVLMHYAPIAHTLDGEPEAIQPFLGSSRLAQPLDTYGASVVFHGHAHHGTHEGRTPGGVPVYNVALPVLRQSGRNFCVWTARAPERRSREGEGEEEETAAEAR